MLLNKKFDSAQANAGRACHLELKAFKASGMTSPRMPKKFVEQMKHTSVTAGVLFVIMSSVSTHPDAISNLLPEDAEPASKHWWDILSVNRTKKGHGPKVASVTWHN